MHVDMNSTTTVAPPLTVLLYGGGNESVVRDKSFLHVLRKPNQQSAGKARNVFVLVPATELPHVSRFISTVNRRNQLKALLVREDVEASSIPQMFMRAHLKMLRNTIVHSDESVPRRLLTAWAHNAQDQLIAKATASADRLFVLSCALKQFEVAFEEMPALKRIPKEERSTFSVDEDGSYLHWPGSDIHIDLDAIRTAKGPKARANAVALKARHDERYGFAIAKLRIAAGLKQSDIAGSSERQVRRIEKGQGTSSEALQCLATAHHMSLDNYLKAIAANVPIPTHAG